MLLLLVMGKVRMRTVVYGRWSWRGVSAENPRRGGWRRGSVCGFGGCGLRALLVWDIIGVNWSTHFRRG